MSEADPKLLAMAAEVVIAGLLASLCDMTGSQVVVMTQQHLETAETIAGSMEMRMTSAGLELRFNVDKLQRTGTADA